MTSRILLIILALFFSSAAHADDTGQQGTSVRALLDYALNQTGAAYRGGGTNPSSGFDCSGFVRYVFDHVEGLSLPHSSRAMSLIGRRISFADLKPGDLVFFRTVRNRISHVGIYLGDNQFIHATSTRTGSVMVSDITESYWAKHLSLARRIIFPDEPELAK